VDRREAEDDASPAGLCGSCRNVRIIRGDKRNIYYLCRLSAKDSRYAKYPALPVTDCAGFVRREPPT